jgi:hypothetical protein
MRNLWVLLILATLILSLIITKSAYANETYKLFSCTAYTGNGEKGDFNWWDYTYSGFQWIDCIVNVDHVIIKDIKINRGNCSVTDNFLTERQFLRGENIKISHTCMDPIMLEITDESRTSFIDLK